MRNVIVEISDCNDCYFKTEDENMNFYCTFRDTDNQINSKYLPLQVGKSMLLRPTWCFLNKKTITFCLKGAIKIKTKTKK